MSNWKKLLSKLQKTQNRTKKIKHSAHLLFIYSVESYGSPKESWTQTKERTKAFRRASRRKNFLDFPWTVCCFIRIRWLIWLNTAFELLYQGYQVQLVPLISNITYHPYILQHCYWRLERYSHLHWLEDNNISHSQITCRSQASRWKV